MSYENSELPKIMKAYHEVESELRDFLSISAFALKDKTYKKKKAESSLKAIAEYRKLPKELRQELEKDKDAYVSNIDQVEKLCKESLF